MPMASFRTTAPSIDRPLQPLDTDLSVLSKRALSADDDPPQKRLKSMTMDEPQVYSDAVRKKLAATSRTGQACDRCKERKMKCDTDPIACQPCRQKNLQCYTTDRVTGQARERGQSNRNESELQQLREQNAAYRRRYGTLQLGDMHALPPIHNGHSTSPTETERTSLSSMPSAHYIGWPSPGYAEPLRHGPIHGTEVDVLDGVIDVGDFECDLMKDYPLNQLNVFNVSRTSISNTTTGYQTITDPRLPPKDEAIQIATTYLLILNQYAPILHRPSFMTTVNHIYDKPQSATLAERVQLALVLAIVTFQAAVRNHTEAAEKFEQSHYWLHYGLTWYRELIRERSLPAMQALALMLLHFRNMPKPGYSWAFGHNVMMKAIELDYHRDPDKITLPLAENNPLGKELRKRVFHSILGICVTTGCKVSKPAPWQFEHMDVPLPQAVMDSGVSETEIDHPAGKCDFWPCLQLAKLLPLLKEAYNYVTSVRRPEAEYVRIVETLHLKIDAWRRDWDKCIEDDESHVNLKVATLLLETWAAEYILNLYHPSLCPDRSPEVMERHLDICHKQAQRLLKSFHILSQRYKGVDFTWHSTAAYAMGFGVTLYIYSRRKSRASHELFEVMRNELKGWLSLMAYADLVMRTGNHLQHIFEPRVNKLESEYLELLTRPSFEPSTNPHTPSSSVNGSAPKAFVKPEAGPGSVSLSTTSTTGSFQSGPTQSDTASIYTATHPSSSQSWQPIQYNGASTGSSPAFTNYNANVSIFNTAPTSLAPILNEPSRPYSGMPTTSSISNDVMTYAPAHYTEATAPGPSSWPTITLPTQEQQFNQNEKP